MARKKSTAKRDAPGRSISGMLREFITARDLTDYQLGQLAGVDPGAIGRFMRRERELSGPTIDRLCEALGLGLVERASRGRGRPARESGGPPPSAKRGRPDGDLDLSSEDTAGDHSAGHVDRLDPDDGREAHQADEP